MLPRLTPKQRQKASALIKRLCANYDNGNCLALDDGEPCVCVQSISSRSESHSETEITETDDGNGNIVQTETTVTKTTLYITVSHKTVEEMADLYGFDAEQQEYLAELLKDENNSI